MPQSPITLKSFAKLNLFLEVVRKMDDGYHEIRTVFTPIGLHDTIELEKATEGIALSCDAPSIPVDSGNLAHKAASLFFESTGITEGVNITIQKRIPIAAGLGGGSSNAAATLIGVNRLFGKALDRAALLKLSTKIGADVSFFIDPKPVYAEGRGDVFVSALHLPELHFVLINPRFEVSTAWAYNNLTSYAETARESMQNTLTSFKSVKDIAAVLKNSLEEPVIKEHPVIGDIKDKLKDHGSKGSLMSGSGPTVFGIYETRDDAASAVRRLKAAMPDFLILHTSSNF